MAKRITLVLLAVILAAIMIYSRYRESVNKAYIEEYHAAALTLQQQQNIRKDELERLRKEREQNRKTAKGILLFQEINRKMYGNAFPIIQKYGFVGTMVITNESYPGQLGFISVEQMNDLLDHGWSICAGWSGKGDIERELQKLESLFIELGLDHPYVISIDEGGYDPAMDAVLAEKGYLAVILHGDSISAAADGADSVIRAVPAIYWDEPAALDYLEYAMQKKELVVLSVDFSSVYGGYYSDLFENMCIYLQDNGEEITFSDLQTAVQNSKTDAYYAAMEEYLLREIEQYDIQIQKVYELYQQYGVNLPQTNDPTP